MSNRLDAIPDILLMGPGPSSVARSDGLTAAGAFRPGICLERECDIRFKSGIFPFASRWIGRLAQPQQRRAMVKLGRPVQRLKPEFAGSAAVL